MKFRMTIYFVLSIIAGCSGSQNSIPETSAAESNSALLGIEWNFVSFTSSSGIFFEALSEIDSSFLLVANTEIVNRSSCFPIVGYTLNQQNLILRSIPATGPGCDFESLIDQIVAEQQFQILSDLLDQELVYTIEGSMLVLLTSEGASYSFN